MKLLITGASGLLGSKLTEIGVKKGWKVYSGYFKHESTRGTRIRFDVSNKQSVNKMFKEIRPEAVVHAAALTDVDKCEVKKELAWKINVQGTRNIADASNRHSAFVLYVSTDYVFDGDKGMYKETDECNPINYYGLTKLEGENEVRNWVDKWCITRTSVIYGSTPATGKTNFALWVLDKLRKKKHVKIVIDQWISPTLNTSLSKIIIEVLERKKAGLFHLAGATRVSRLNMAKAIAKTFQLEDSYIRPVSMKDIHWKARRPRDSSLDVAKTKNMFANKPLTLNQGLKELRTELNYPSNS